MVKNIGFQSLLLLSFSVFVTLKEIEILALADIHLDLFYKSDASADGFCRNSKLKAEIDAPLGRAGCDTPLALLESVLQHAAQTVNPKYLLINGDAVGHNIAHDYGKETVLETHQIVFDLVTSIFPQAVIIPSIGNNDVLKHNNVPRYIEAEQYYYYLFDLWFGPTSLAKNNRELLDAHAQEQFDKGGFYSVQITDDLTLLVFNSIFYQASNNLSNDPRGAKKQMDWIENTLENAPEGMKFIPLYHVNVGTDNFGTYSWHQQFQNQFLELQKKYQDKIIIDWVAHIHQATFRGYLDAKTGVAYGGALHSPALSPVYLNNPSFRVYTLETGDEGTIVKGYQDYSLQLEQLNTSGNGKVLYSQNKSLAWNSQYSNEFVGIDNFSAETIQQYWQQIIDTPHDFDNYLLQSGGYDSSELEKVKENYETLFNVKFPTTTEDNWDFYCRMMCPGHDNYSYCVDHPPED